MGKYDSFLQDTATYNLKLPKTFITFLKRKALDESEQSDKNITHAEIARRCLLSAFKQEYQEYLDKKK